ncbi:Protein F47B7.1 [Aphelenchoides avenae]|nr:Protein F47B7.1 [Aphelenchus avenae]
MRLVLLSLTITGALLCGIYAAPITGSRNASRVNFTLDPERQSPFERFVLYQRRSDDVWTVRQMTECIFSIFLPPAAVLFHGGNVLFLHFVINIILWVLGWVPGSIHAVWYCFVR